MLSKVLNYFNLFKVKPIDESLLAKKVDSMPQPVNPQITDAVTQLSNESPQAAEIKVAVAEKIVEKPQQPAPAKKTRRPRNSKQQ